MVLHLLAGQPAAVPGLEIARVVRNDGGAALVGLHHPALDVRGRLEQAAGQVEPAGLHEGLGVGRVGAGLGHVGDGLAIARRRAVIILRLEEVIPLLLQGLGPCCHIRRMRALGRGRHDGVEMKVPVSQTIRGQAHGPRHTAHGERGVLPASRWNATPSPQGGQGDSGIAHSNHSLSLSPFPPLSVGTAVAVQRGISGHWEGLRCPGARVPGCPGDGPAAASSGSAWPGCPQPAAPAAPRPPC